MRIWSDCDRLRLGLSPNEKIEIHTATSIFRITEKNNYIVIERGDGERCWPDPKDEVEPCQQKE